MAWLILVLAGLFETGWAIGLKYTEGFYIRQPHDCRIFNFALRITSRFEREGSAILLEQQGRYVLCRRLVDIVQKVSALMEPELLPLE